MRNKIQKPGSTNSILMVSGDLEALRTARAYLTTEGYSVMTASSLEEASQLCKKTTPALVILDAGFPAGFSKKIVDVLETFFHEREGDNPNEDCEFNANDR